MRPNDPRIRQTLNQITQNLESANETAQEGIYAFSHNYISPCLASVRGCLVSCTAPCFPSRDDTLRRRKRGRSRGRAELAFDFYDDWDYTDEVRGDSGLLGWSHDELDRLLAGSGAGRASGDQPRRNRRMSYGARRKALPNDERQDPTVIPSSSILGFLERFPWRIGAKGIRYMPSGADLQENPGGAKRDAPEEAEPLLEGSDESDAHSPQVGPEDGQATPLPGGRQRSGTQSSRETRDSLSSRGDLWPSDEEEDAVPLDDEFAMAPRFQMAEDDSGPPHRLLSRTASGTSTKDSVSPDSRVASKGKGKSRKNSSRKASRTTRSPASEPEVIERIDVPTLEDLKMEEERVQMEEEREIERRRQAALHLARSRGLGVDDDQAHESLDTGDTPAEPDDAVAVSAVSEPLSDNPADYPIPPSPDLAPERDYEVQDS